MGNGFDKHPENINRKGRPRKKTSLTDILVRHGRKRDVISEGGMKMSRKEAIAQKAWALALAGDLAAIKYIYDRIDGRPKESVDLSGDVDHTVRIDRVLYDAVHGRLNEDGTTAQDGPDMDS